MSDGRPAYNRPYPPPPPGPGAASRRERTVTCPVCRGSGGLQEIGISALLATAELADTEQPWRSTRCPICGGGGDVLAADVPSRPWEELHDAARAQAQAETGCGECGVATGVPCVSDCTAIPEGLNP